MTVKISAQENYEKGFIVNYNNDTIKGLIHLKTRHGLVEKCEFLRNNSSLPEVFSTNEIKSIKTGYKYYTAKKIYINNENKIVFLEVIFEGVVNAFYLDNKNFFIEKGDSIYHLSIEERMVTNEYGTQYYVESKKHFGIISYLIKDEPALAQKMGNNRLNSKLLVKIFKEYCEKTCPGCSFMDYTRNKKRNSVFVEPHVGFSYAILRFPTSHNSHSCLSPIGGINIHIPSIQNHRWNYIFGINYSSYKFQGDYTHSIYDKLETYRVLLKYSTLNIPLLLEYSFNDKKIQPIIKFGYNNVFVLHPDNSLKLVYDKSIIIDIQEKEPVNRFYQYGFIFGGGINYEINSKSFLKLNCNFEFRLPSTNAHYFYDKQKIYLFQINMSYSFKIK